MKRKLVGIAVAVTMLFGIFAGCSTARAATTAPADLVFKNGVIQTMVKEGDTAQAVAVTGDEIVYVGDDKGVEAYVGNSTKVIDLKGQFMSPGFMDGHIHGPGMWLDRLFNISLEDMDTNEEYLKAIKKFVDENPDMEVYSGRPFMLNAYQLPDGSNPGPLRSDLDAICSDKPIIIRDVSGHSAWVNSKAMELGGITDDTKDPAGGNIYRNKDGKPSGCLTDAAMQLVTDKIPITYTNEQYKQAIEKFMKEANSYGITGLTNLTRGGADINSIYSEMDKAGDLSLRMRIVNTLQPSGKYADVLKMIKDGSKFDSDMMTTGTVKIFYDGVTESGTAVMLEPYLPEAGKGAEWHGEPVWNDEDFFRMVKYFDAEGVQVHVHAIGDGAVQKTLDAFEEARKANGKRDARHTITHVCAVTDEDIKRFAELDIISALQFLWMYADPLYDLEAAYIGKDRALAMYPTQKMIDEGCFITGASDAPVTPYKVLDEIEVGITRNSPYAGEDSKDMHRWPEQALSPYQMLEAYTKNVAYENFMEDLTGTIEVGKKADMVVLADNILKIDPAKISDTKIVYTVSNGKIVYTG